VGIRRAEALAFGERTVGRSAARLRFRTSIKRMTFSGGGLVAAAYTNSRRLAFRPMASKKENPATGMRGEAPAPCFFVRECRGPWR
jgi:hypothetical protein